MPREKLRVLVLFGTRPELIKLAPVIQRLQHDDRFQTGVVTTSQHREIIADLLRLFAISPDYDLDIIQPDQSLTDISSRVLQRLPDVFSSFRPDLVLVQGDTSSAFIGALAAFYHKVPVAHVEAGLRSFDKLHPYPEEVNRRLISVLSELHFAPLAGNAQALLREGVPASAISVTGNTVIDALRDIQARGGSTLEKYVPREFMAGRRLLLVTAHRRESFGEHLEQLCKALRTLVTLHPDLAVIYPVHPNPRVRQSIMPLLGDCDRVLLIEPLPYETFVEAMSRAYLIVTDSGGVQEEAPSLGKPVLVFRKVTERGEGISSAGVKLVGLDGQRLVEEVTHLLEDDDAYAAMAQARNLYGDGQASRRIVQAILHYFDQGEPPDQFTGTVTT